jgi:hypothetical protein
MMELTTVHPGQARATFEPVELPDLQQAPERRDTEVRFVQTTGGRTGLPAPRRVKHPPFLHSARRRCGRRSRSPCAPTAPPTSRCSGEQNSRHWVYDAEGKVAAKVGLANFKDWYRGAFGKHTPWGAHAESQALVTVETCARAADVGHDHVGR